jgi:hypothetical protein
LEGSWTPGISKLRIFNAALAMLEQEGPAQTSWCSDPAGVYRTGMSHPIFVMSAAVMLAQWHMQLTKFIGCNSLIGALS